MPSSKLPTPYCGKTTEDLFVTDALKEKDDWWQPTKIDIRTGLLATEMTPPQFVQERGYLVVPPEVRDSSATQAKEWATLLGGAAPSRAEQSRRHARSSYRRLPRARPSAAALPSPGRANSADFQSYRLEYGVGASPTEWAVIYQSTTPVDNSTLAVWNTTGLPAGQYTLRLVVNGRDPRRPCDYDNRDSWGGKPVARRRPQEARPPPRPQLQPAGWIVDDRRTIGVRTARRHPLKHRKSPPASDRPRKTWSATGATACRGGQEPLRPDLQLSEVRRGLKPGSRYVRITPSSQQTLRRMAPAHAPGDGRPAAAAEPASTQLWTGIRRVFVGSPLTTSQAINQRLDKVRALAIFSADVISSTAYATEEILLVLVLAGMGALNASLPIAGVIALLLDRRCVLLPADRARLPQRRRLVHGRAGEPGDVPGPDRRLGADDRLRPDGRCEHVGRHRRHHLRRAGPLQRPCSSWR